MAKEWKEQYPEIPWSQISGVRHRLVHNYEDTNWKIIAEVLLKELDIFFDAIGKDIATVSQTLIKVSLISQDNTKIPCGTGRL